MAPPFAQFKGSLRATLSPGSVKTALFSVAAVARAVNQRPPSSVLIVPPSSSTQANRRGHLAKKANRRSGGGALLSSRFGIWASVSVTLEPKSPRHYQTRTAVPALTRDLYSNFPHPSHPCSRTSATSAPAPPLPLLPPRSLRSVLRSQVPAPAARGRGPAESLVHREEVGHLVRSAEGPGRLRVAFGVGVETVGS